MLNGKVYVIGMGAISAIGNDPGEMFESLIHAKHGLSYPQHIVPNFPQQPLTGEIRLSNRELQEKTGVSHKYPSRTFLLGYEAAAQAIRQAMLTAADLREAALISATTVGGMDLQENFMRQHHENPGMIKPAMLAQHDAGAFTEHIARQAGVGGFFTTINTACSSSANAIMLGARMIRQGKANVVIAGGADALTEFTLQGFRSLMLVSDRPCRPFDRDRNGLNLGEGAAFLVLCSEAFLQDRIPMALLAGWGNANDAYHATASSPEGRGARMAMEEALLVAGIEPSAIQYINAHGTATPNNDQAEASAMAALFGTPPPFSSTKTFTGHTLAAAGSLEAVISCLALRSGQIFPNLNFENPIESPAFTPQLQVATANPEYVLSNSFGFGGNCSSLIFRKI